MNVAALMVAAGTIWIVAMANVPAEKQGQLTTTERVAGTLVAHEARRQPDTVCGKRHMRALSPAHRRVTARTAMARTATRGSPNAPGARGPEFQDRRPHPRDSNEQRREPVFVSDGKDRISNVLAGRSVQAE